MAKKPPAPRDETPTSVTQTEKIKRRLMGESNGLPSLIGLVASICWCEVCIVAVDRGEITVGRDVGRGLDRALYRKGVYPPGGKDTLMVQNEHGRWMPPDFTPRALDSREDNLDDATAARLPSSSSAINLHRIRATKAAPQKHRMRHTRN